MLFGHPDIAERPYAGCGYVARIDFEYGPHAFKSGDAFDRSALGLTEDQAQQLWVAGRLLVKPVNGTPQHAQAAPRAVARKGRG